MKKEFEKFGILTEEISDEDIDFKKLQDDEDDDNVLATVEDPKIQESLSTVSADDSVKIYMRQIGKIPLLSSEEELDLAKNIKNKKDEFSKNLLVNARDGICLTHDELIDLVNLIKPLIKQGLSPYAIWEIYKNKMPITERTFYNYMELGIMDIASIDLPRKVRYKDRDNKNKRKKTIVRIGREYCDYLNIPEEKRKNVFQIDTVHGFKYNKQRIFTMHNPLREFQFYNLIRDGRAERIIKIFDMYEEYLGSMELFKKIFGLILADRGDEFDMYNMLERSIYNPYKKRCHVYFCDPNRPDQKGSAENNHELLRRILEKGYSDFDKLSNADVALACSHVNSYPRKSLNGNAPIELIEKMVPQELLNKLGIEHLQPEEVVLKPSLLKHAISY